MRLGRITSSFRIRFSEELQTLKQFREALMDTARRDAFDSLEKVWSSEMGAMSIVNIPSALDIMILTAAIDNRKLLLKIMDELEILETKILKIEKLKSAAEFEEP